MITEKRVIVISLFIFAIIVATLIYDKYKPQDVQWATITTQEKALLLSGDILFTEGHSFKSDLVRMASGTKDGQHYSHCGVISIDNNQVYVVHMSIDKGVITKEPIDSFWSNNKVNSYGVCRAEGFESRAEMEAELNNLLLNKVRFDNSYNAMDNKELYCTELICYLFSKVSDLNLYPFENLKDNIYPNNLYEIPILTKIL